MKSEILSLFPTPIFKSQYFINIDDITEYCLNTEYRGNDTNIQSSNTFVLNEPVFYKLRQFIENKLAEYILKIHGSYQEIDITQSWLNKSGKNGSHRIHSHPNSFVSGVFYIQLDDDMPQLNFYRQIPPAFLLDSNIITDFTTDYFSLNAEKGTLVLFPSYLKHAVPENKSEKDRISLSFNTFPKGAFGNYDRLTYCDPNS